SFEVDLSEREGHLVARVDGREVPVDFRRVRGAASWSLLLGDASYPLSFEPRPDGLSVTVESESYLVRVEDERTRAARAVAKGRGSRDESKTVLSVMPGIVRDVRIAVGDEVEVGQPLLILEAMKMENEIRAVLPGVVKAVHVKPDTTVNKGDALVTLE
ncbi:MAG: acyl-CoA carboxylase biotin carboxyl carrier protein subunit, partial [Planctomycetota bacterium]